MSLVTQELWLEDLFLKAAHSHHVLMSERQRIDVIKLKHLRSSVTKSWISRGNNCFLVPLCSAKYLQPASHAYGEGLPLQDALGCPRLPLVTVRVPNWAVSQLDHEATYALRL